MQNIPMEYTLNPKYIQWKLFLTFFFRKKLLSYKTDSRFQVVASIPRSTLSQTNPGFYVSAVQVFWKHCG